MRIVKKDTSTVTAGGSAQNLALGFVPINQRDNLGYQYLFETRLLNDNWISRIASTLASS